MGFVRSPLKNFDNQSFLMEKIKYLNLKTRSPKKIFKMKILYGGDKKTFGQKAQISVAVRKLVVICLKKF